MPLNRDLQYRGNFSDYRNKHPILPHHSGSKWVEKKTLIIICLCVICCLGLLFFVKKDNFSSPENISDASTIRHGSSLESRKTPSYPVVENPIIIKEEVEPQKVEIEIQKEPIIRKEHVEPDMIQKVEPQKVEETKIEKPVKTVEKEITEQIVEDKKQNEVEQPKYTFSGILLHFKRRNGIKAVLGMMLKYSFISQIIVWNNDPGVVLTLEMLLDDKLSVKQKSKQLDVYKKMVYIHNHDKNIKDKAKYLACSLANTTVCFYSDDDWDITRYTRSLLADFYNEPGVMHSVTEPYTYYTNLIWSFYDNNINLHTGFAWIGCGSMFLKELAIKHLEKVDKFLESNADLKSLVPLSDVFFSIWQNNPPSQIVADIAEVRVEREDVAFSSQGGFQLSQHKSSVQAIKILHDELKFNTNSTIFNKKEIENPFPLYLKSSSTRDNFLFYSNLNPFPLKDVKFDITNPSHAKRSTRENLPSGSLVDEFTANSPTRAVDADPASCWKSNRDVTADSFFGADLFSIRTDFNVMVQFSHPVEFHTSLKIRHSTDRKNWRENSVSSTTSGNTSRHNFSDSVRFIEFYSANTTSQRFVVCDFQVLNKDGTPIQ